MAKKYMTLVTTVGKNKILKAANTGKKVTISKLKIGDGNGSNYLIDENQTDLKNVVYETKVTSYTVDPVNINTITVETRIPSEAGPFYIRELGLYDEDDDLIVLSSYEETYKPVAKEGSTMELFIRMALVLSNMDSIEIKIDPSIVMVTKADLEKIYKLIGDLGTASKKFKDTSSIVVMLLELKALLDGLELTDEKIDCVEESKKLNEVIKDLKESIEGVEKSTKNNSSKVDNLVLDDEHIDVKAKNKKLNIVIKEFEDKDAKIVNLISDYKDSMDGYFKDLGTEVNRHSKTNDNLEKLL